MEENGTEKTDAVMNGREWFARLDAAFAGRPSWSSEDEKRDRARRLEQEVFEFEEPGTLG